MVVRQDDVPLLSFPLSEGADVQRSRICYMPVLWVARREGASQEVTELLVKHGPAMTNPNL